MNPAPAPRLDLVDDKQRTIIVDIMFQLQRLDYTQKKIEPVLPDLVTQFAAACPDDAALNRMGNELYAWVRWRRVPSYWLTFLFQLVTHQEKSGYHVVACLLFSQSQVCLNDDFYVTSLETAYHTLIQIRGDSDNSLLKRVSDDLESRLRLHHDFLAAWCRPFDYMECNPISEHMYSELTWRDLRGEFPQLQASSPPKASDFLTVIEQCTTSDVVYYRILARRRLGLLYRANQKVESALEQFQAGLVEAHEVQLDTEIGHLHRLCGHALRALGHDADAVREFERAVSHEAPPYCAYWKALSSRELGDARAGLLQRQGVDFTKHPETLEPAHLAYRGGLQMFEAHLGAQPAPATRALKQQMFRSFTGNALNVASILGRSSDIVAEVDANGPRQIADVVAEMIAARDLSAESSLEFQRDREVFHRHLTTIPDRFEDYLQSIQQDNAARQSYLRQRQRLTGTITRSQLSAQVASQVLDLRIPNTVFVLFDLGWHRSTIVLIDVGAGEVWSDSVPLDEQQVRAWHDDYAEALRASAGRSDPGPPSQDALDRLLAHYDGALGPKLEAFLPFLTGRQLKIFPRLHLNSVPFHALTVGGTPLIDACTVSYGQTLGLFLNVHRVDDVSTTRALTMAWDDVGAPLFEGVRASIAPVYGPGLTVLANPPWLNLASTVEQEDATDLFFACHGEFNPDNPAASRLGLGDPPGITFSRVFSELSLHHCRSVTLGACESGLARSEIAAEYVGLPSAFLAAGVRYVVGSLWKVNQLATAILLERYFSALAEPDASLPQALKGAQQYLKALSRDDARQWVQTHLPAMFTVLAPVLDRLEEQPYTHPYFWSGLYVSGDV